MQSGRRSRLALAVLAWAVAVPARAQTSDVLFGGWSWRSPEQGSRPAGLGASYVAVADSLRTVAVNPAGLALIPRAELSLGFGGFWAGAAYSLGRVAAPANAPPSGRPTQPSAPLPCAPVRPTRPLAVAVFVEQAVTQENQIAVVRGPGQSEAAQLSSTTEQIGLGLARGLTPWLDLGATVAWRHLTMDGQSSVLNLAGDELSRVTLGGDANKARGIAGLLLTFGPSRDPTALRLGVAYHQDLFSWSVERTAIDRVGGVVSGPTTVDVVEPPLLSAGMAWRVSDTLLVSGEVDYIWYDRVSRALERNTSATAAAPFALENGVEPRLGIEVTEPSPTGGYFKLRAGIRRETSGRPDYVGDDPALHQAFGGGAAAYRAAAGVSLLGEFYSNAIRFDLDVSQVVVQRLTALSAAGRRRVSFAVTVRM